VGDTWDYQAGNNFRLPPFRGHTKGSSHLPGRHAPALFEEFGKIVDVLEADALRDFCDRDVDVTAG